MSIKARFCVKCGKQINKLIDSLCPDCYLKLYAIKVPRRVSIQICKRCGAIKWRGMWIKSGFPPEHYIEHELLAKIKVPKDVELERVKIIKSGKHGEIELTLRLLGKKVNQKHKLAIEVVARTCKNCARVLGGAYKAILQLRAEKPMIEKMLLFARKYRSNITKIESLKSGADLFMASKEAARHLAAELRKEFKLKISESTEQYGWNKSKNQPLTRAVIALRPKTFKG